MVDTTAQGFIYKYIRDYILDTLFETRAAFTARYEAECELLGVEKVFPALNLLDELSLEDLFFVESSIGRFDVRRTYARKSGHYCVSCERELDISGTYYIESRGRSLGKNEEEIEYRETLEYFIFYPRELYTEKSQEYFYSYDQLLVDRGLEYLVEGRGSGSLGIRAFSICEQCVGKFGSESVRAVCKSAIDLSIARWDNREAYIQSVAERLPVKGLESLAEEYVWWSIEQGDKVFLFDLEYEVDSMARALQHIISEQYGAGYLYGRRYVNSSADLKRQLEECIAKYLFLRCCLRGVAKIYPVTEYAGFCEVGDPIEEVEQMKLYKRFCHWGSMIYN